MDSSLKRDASLSTQIHPLFFHLSHLSIILLSFPSCPSLRALADVFRVSVAWTASVLVSAEREGLRGTAGWVQGLEGSSLLAKASISTAKSLHLFTM